MNQTTTHRQPELMRPRDVAAPDPHTRQAGELSANQHHTLLRQRTRWYAALATVIMTAMLLKVIALGYFLATRAPITAVNIVIWAVAVIGAAFCYSRARRCTLALRPPASKSAERA